MISYLLLMESAWIGFSTGDFSQLLQDNQTLKNMRYLDAIVNRKLAVTKVEC